KQWSPRPSCAPSRPATPAWSEAGRWATARRCWDWCRALRPAGGSAEPAAGRLAVRAVARGLVEAVASAALLCRRTFLRNKGLLVDVRVAEWAPTVIGRAPQRPRGRGGIGRRAGFRFQYRKMWGFESLRPHQSRRRRTKAFIGTLTT